MVLLLHLIRAQRPRLWRLLSQCPPESMRKKLLHRNYPITIHFLPAAGTWKHPEESWLPWETGEYGTASEQFASQNSSKRLDLGVPASVTGAGSAGT